MCESITFDHAQDIGAIIGDYQAFIDDVVSQLSAAGLDITAFEMDHICYRCETLEEYVRICGLLESKYGTSLGQPIVGGRPINTIRLHCPLVHGVFSVGCLEIPSPKDGSFYSSGLEHAEMVIGSISDSALGAESKAVLERFVAQCKEGGFKLPFDTRAINKAINPDVSVELNHASSRTEQNGKLSVKFHVRPLMEVVELEHKMELEGRSAV